MVWILYYAGIYLMVLGIRISSLWDPKSRLWLQGRRNWDQALETLPSKKNTRIWFHVSSLGEFEQARPVIEKLKSDQPGYEIVLTFFSPSGYQIRSNYPLATVLYLPADLPGSAKKWLSKIEPDMAVFVKYDVWPGYLVALHRNRIPTILISAHWVAGRGFHSWSIPPARALLKKCQKIFLQQGVDLSFLRQKGFQNLAVAGDTRIDRALELPGEIDNKLPELFLEAGPFDIVAGSTWSPDEKILAEAIMTLRLKALLVPHDVSEANVTRLISTLPFHAQRFSELKTGDRLADVIIIDRIGLLGVLYTIGHVAYVGGGFGKGIHNILEPMAHQKPLIFGPKYKRFPEAQVMVEQEGAWIVNGQEDLIRTLSKLQSTEMREKAGWLAKKYLIDHSGASETVSRYIMESIPCTPIK